MDIVTPQQIEATESFKKIEKSIQPLYLKRVNREKINHALIVYKNTGYIDENIGRHSVNIVKDLIKIQENEKNTHKQR
jgi:hypothetical protein